MGSNSDQVSKIPTVDLTGLRPSGERWETARAAVVAAMQSHGCFEAVYPPLSPELRQELFDAAVPELFSLPLESKRRSTSGEPYQGYVGQIPHLAYESLRINVDSPADVGEFTRLMWPQGNPAFHDAVVAFSKPLGELAETVQKMILQSLGVEKHYDDFVKSSTHGIRLSWYGVPPDQETKIGLDPHIDANLVSIVCQHNVGGLEVETADGRWVNAEPFPNSVYVMAGLAFQAWSNNGVRAPLHRVRMLGSDTRFSAIYGTRPKDNSIVRSPEELGVDDHPLLYRPFNYTEFFKFMYSEKRSGRKQEDAFNSYCRLVN